MKGTEGTAAYERFRDGQITLASVEDMLFMMAQELVRMKDETGVNLFWDNSEEEFMRDYIKNEKKVVHN